MANTSSRALRLLSLLQTHRFWPGGELAGRLEVSERTLRRDIDRLRELGYPVDSVRGVEGGYQLGQGATMPPLTVDSPFSEAPTVRADVLATVAQTTRDTERLRFAYRARGGQAAGEEVRRHVEPHQLVTVGRRWYLVGYDLDRQDWRSFRLDRLRDPMGTRARFRPRGIPGGDAADYVRKGLSRNEAAMRVVARVQARPEDVEPRVGRWATVESVGDDECRVTMQARDPRWAIFGLGVLETPFSLEEAPDELRAQLAAWADRFASATSPTPRRRGRRA